MSKKLTGVLKEQVNQIFGLMQQHGVRAIAVEFDGAGDSGQIEDITTNPEGSPILEVQVHYRLLSRNFVQVQDGGYDYEDVTTEHDGKFSDLLENIVYRLLERDHSGWEINEGSFGTFTFDADNLKVISVYNERVESVATSEEELE